MKSQVEIVNMAQHRDEKRSEAIIRKGQRAWTAIKSTAEEQRFWWLDVGAALREGKDKANRKPGQKFSDWVQEEFPGLNQDTAADAIWFASNSVATTEITADLSHPKNIRVWFNEQQATQALPALLQEIAPTSTPVLTQRDAERVAKTIHRAASGDEGAETALRHLGALAKKHGMTVEGLTDSAKTGAPDIYFRFAPQLQGSIDQFRQTMAATVTQMEQQGISRDAIKHILINIAHSI